METNKISKKLLKRLPVYLAHLKSLPENSNVSATSIAKALDWAMCRCGRILPKFPRPDAAERGEAGNS